MIENRATMNTIRLWCALIFFSAAASHTLQGATAPALFKTWLEWTERNKGLDRRALDTLIPESPSEHPLKQKVKKNTKALLTKLVLPARDVTHEDTSYTPKTLADMNGTPPEIMSDLIAHLKNPKKFPCPKAVMFHGPPGTGKTLGAKAIAGEAGAIFYHTNGSEAVNKYVGVGAEYLRNLFADAEKEVKNGHRVVIFIDEIEQLCASRDSGNMNGEYHQTLNQLLALVSHIQDNYKDLPIVILGATNHKDNVDAAAIRKGRFDLVEIGLPDEASRFAILKEKARAANTNINDKLFKTLAKQTKDFNGAELENIIFMAQKRARKNDKKTFGAGDINAVFPDLKKQQLERIKTEQEKERRKKAREYIENEQLKQAELQRWNRIYTLGATIVAVGSAACQHVDKIQGPLIAGGHAVKAFVESIGKNPPAA